MKPYKEIQTEIKSEHQIVQTLKHLIFIFLLTFSVASCKNMGNPSTEILAYYNLGHSDLIQIGDGGEYLPDSLFVQIYNQLSAEDIVNYRIDFEVLTGAGSVDKAKLFTRKDGKAVTRWKLGKEKFKQTALAKIYNPEGIFLSQIQFTAYGSLPNTWNEVDFPPLSQVADIAADTLNKISWMISSSKVYKRGSDFLDWQPVNETKLKGAREIEIDKNGIVYIGNWYGELFKSTDQGQNWIKCTNPIPDHPYYFYFWITNDGDLWVTHPDRGTWHTKDGGVSWTNPSSNFLNGAFRLKNGWILSLIAPKGEGMRVMKSEDDGKSWSSLLTPKYPYSFFVAENEDIIVFTQSIAGIYKSTNTGQSFNMVNSGVATFNTGSLQTYVHKFGSYYYMTIPGYGVLKTNNFEQFQTVFSETSINGLYIDHTGSLIVPGTLEKRNKTFFYGKE